MRILALTHHRPPVADDTSSRAPDQARRRVVAGSALRWTGPDRSRCAPDDVPDRSWVGYTCAPLSPTSGDHITHRGEIRLPRLDVRPIQVGRSA